MPDLGTPPHPHPRPGQPGRRPQQGRLPLFTLFPSRFPQHSTKARGSPLQSLYPQLGFHEATFRLNEGDVKHHTFERLSALALKAFTTRITYRQLTHDACC